jgi:rod shape determining protein RodA
MIASSIIPAPLARLPWRVILLVLAIGGFGLTVLYSAAGGSITPWALPQGIRFFFFLGLAVMMSWLSEAQIKAAVVPGYIVILIMLILVEALGFIGGGAQRWLDLGFIRIQPSELMKLAVVLAVARFYDLLPAGEVRGWSAVWIPLAIIGAPSVLVLLQPDLGTTLMIVGGGVTVMFLAGIPMRLFVGSGIAFAAALPIALATLHEYQRKRVLIFLDPEADPLGSGYHISQSKIAIGSGGIFGKGFGNGTQAHLSYLPEPQTDFVFATMAEEWGLVGGVLLILAYMLVIFWGMSVANRAKSRFARLTAAGLSMTIFFYVAINLMMVMGFAPVVGIPLPLVSFGGSAIMTVMLCLGILMALERHQRSNSRFA